MKSCKTCKFWSIEQGKNKGLDRNKEQGQCLKIGVQYENNAHEMAIIATSTYGYGELLTTEDFGCILHENINKDA